MNNPVELTLSIVDSEDGEREEMSAEPLLSSCPILLYQLRKVERRHVVARNTHTSFN